MFDFLIDILNENGKGIHAYRKCSAAAQKAISQDKDLATPLLLLRDVADDFVQFNERMQLSLLAVNEAYVQFSEYAKSLELAFSGNDAEAKLSALNDVAQKMLCTTTTDKSPKESI